MDSKTLTRIPAQNIKISYLNGETGYFEAFKRHLQVGSQMAGTPTAPSGLEREATQIMFFAVECYLKDVFCALRVHAFGSWDAMPKSMEAEFNKTLGARRFGHDLFALGTAIQEICSNLVSDIDYQLFLTKLPQTDKKSKIEADAWIQSRYHDPADYIKVDFVSDYHIFSELFMRVRTTSFRSFI